MVRSVVLLMAVALVVAAVAGPAAAFVEPVSSSAAPTGSVGSQATDAGNASDVAPGERLTGVVGVTEAEIDGDIRNRTFGIEVAQAATDDAKADVVAEQLRDIEQRLEELGDRKERLAAARENGSISEGEYRAGMARTVAEIHTVRRLANASDRTTRSLPAEVLAEKGINATAIRTLKNRADELTGPEVAEVARSIAGPDAGRSIDRGRGPGGAGDRGPPGDGPGAQNNSERGPPGDGGPGSDEGGDAEDPGSGNDGSRGGGPENGEQ